MAVKKIFTLPTVQKGGASFSDYLTKHPTLDELTFPYGPQGVKQYGRMRKWFWRAVIFLVLGGIFALIHGFVDVPTTDYFSLVSQYVSALSWPNVAGGLLAAAKYVSWFLLGFGGFSSIMCFLMYLVYAGYAVARWRNFERGVFFNDMRAEKIRRDVLRSTNAKAHAKEARQKKSETPGQDELSKIEAKKEFLKMKVFVNTRPSLDSDKLIRYYQIRYDVPFNQDVVTALQPDVEKVGSVAVKVTSGKVNFGQMIQSSDRLFWYFTDQQVVHVAPKTAKTKESSSKGKVENDFEYSFPLTMFKDLRPVIREKTEQAERWGRSKAKALDSVFSTDGTQALRTNLVISAASVMVEYNLSFDLRLDNIESKEKTIDKAFKISGTSLVISDEGMLQVTIPLPKQFRLPIDVSTLYVNTFGRPDYFKD